MPPKLHRPIQLAAPGGEISRKDLTTLARRFLHLHRQRLRSLQAWLNPRQRDCLEILPLLFHRNHPALPGYGSGQAPAGLSDYRPGSATRQALRRLAPGFDYRRQGAPDPPLHGMFLMGSAGSVAYSEHSDLDVWICHRSDLEESDLTELQAKCREIEAWTGRQGLETHFFLIDPSRFRQGQLEPLSRESSGTTQHNLLLEEFYRTAVQLAGRRLLWWMVPPEQENRYREYADHLLGRRFVDPDSVIDLGGLDHVPADEFVSAGLWHLYKALEAPYKALLKLQLVLDYAAAYPRPRWLASEIKAAVYAGRVDPEPLDPYVCLYQRVEQTLVAQGQQDLIPLIRRCFFIKTRPALHHPRHRRQLTALLHNWGWDASPAGWHRIRPQRIEQAEEEWRVLVQTLEQSHRLIRRFTSCHTTGQDHDSDELRLLGRKLRAALERRPDKVDIVRLVPAAGLPEATLALVQEHTANAGWHWRLERSRETAGRPLYQARHLLQVIAWVQANRVAPPGCQWVLLPGPLPLGTAELRFLNQTVQRFLATRPEPGLEVYRHPARLHAAALYVNIAAPARPQRSGLDVTSERFDPLSYGADRSVLIRNLEVLSRNTWGEIEVNRHEGLEGLFDCLCHLYAHGGAKADVQVHCFASRTIALRVADLYQALICTLGRSPAGWFVVQGGARFYLFRQQGGHPGWWECDDAAALTDALGQPRAGFTPVAFDRNALTGSPLPFLYHHNQPGKIQLFLWTRGNGTEVFVLDERGALYQHGHAGAPAKTVLYRYAKLFEALDRRYPGTGAVECAWIDEAEGKWRLRPAEAALVPEPAIEVRVYAEESPGGVIHYTLVCNGNEFCSLDWGEAVFTQAAHHIRRLRRRGADYPLHVSDLSVPARVLGLANPALLHTACLLAYKRKVEQRLNQA